MLKNVDIFEDICCDTFIGCGWNLSIEFTRTLLEIEKNMFIKDQRYSLK